MDVNVVPGTRAGSEIYHCGDGFHYYYNNGNNYGENENTSSILNLRCIKLHSMNCHGTAKINVTPAQGVQWENLQRHTCAPDRLYERIKQLRATIREEATNVNNPHEGPNAIVDRLRTRLCATREGQVVAATVTPASMKSAIQRDRSLMYPAVPITLYQLGQQLQGQHNRITTTNDGADNLFNGMVQGPGFTSLIFLSRRMRRFMSRVRIIFCDGTFNSRPNIPACAQVLQLSTVVRNHVVPLAQVLMTGKTEEEYVAVLEHIRRMVPNMRPTVAMTDYEVGMQNAWQRVFNDIRVAGCYWHFCRAVIKKAKELGLGGPMNASRRLKSIVRAACAIPLLPARLIPRGVECLMAEAGRLGYIPLLTPFFD